MNWWKRSFEREHPLDAAFYKGVSCGLLIAMGMDIFFRYLLPLAIALGKHIIRNW